MKLEFTTTVKGFETANFLLKMAITSCREKPEMMKRLMLTTTELVKAEKLREKMVDAFFKVNSVPKGN